MEQKDLLQMIKNEVGEEKLNEYMEIAWQHTIKVALENYGDKNFERYMMYALGVNKGAINFEELMEHAPSVEEGIDLINDIVLAYYKIIKETNELMISQTEVDNLNKMLGYLKGCGKGVEFMIMCVEKLANKIQETIGATA